VRHIEAGKEAAIEAEMQASRERAVIPLEMRVQQFMEMLTEKEVLCCLEFDICSYCVCVCYSLLSFESVLFYLLSISV